jgi:hypothetical protein
MSGPVYSDASVKVGRNQADTTTREQADLSSSLSRQYQARAAPSVVLANRHSASFGEVVISRTPDGQSMKAVAANLRSRGMARQLMSAASAGLWFLICATTEHKITRHSLISESGGAMLMSTAVLLAAGLPLALRQRYPSNVEFASELQRRG